MAVRKTLCRVAEIPEGGAIERVGPVPDPRTGEVFDESLVVTRQGGVVNAYVNVCPHAGRRLDWAPGQFLIEDGLMICAAHGATFRLGTGECIDGPCRGASLVRVDIEVTSDEVRL
jgi:nitrite reductase/ring-hydroxylating ferredoxin subunit